MYAAHAGTPRKCLSQRNRDICDSGPILSPFKQELISGWYLDGSESNSLIASISVRISFVYHFDVFLIMGHISGEHRIVFKEHGSPFKHYIYVNCYVTSDEAKRYICRNGEYNYYDIESLSIEPTNRALAELDWERDRNERDSRFSEEAHRLREEYFKKHGY